MTLAALCEISTGNTSSEKCPVNSPFPDSHDLFGSVWSKWNETAGRGRARVSTLGTDCGKNPFSWQRAGNIRALQPQTGDQPHRQPPRLTEDGRAGFPTTPSAPSAPPSICLGLLDLLILWDLGPRGQERRKDSSRTQ